jgi:hypothetical protein
MLSMTHSSTPPHYTLAWGGGSKRARARICPSVSVSGRRHSLTHHITQGPHPSLGSEPHHTFLPTCCSSCTPTPWGFSLPQPSCTSIPVSPMQTVRVGRHVAPGSRVGLTWLNLPPGPQLRSPVTHLGANPLTSVSVATVPTTRRRSTIHTPQEGPSLFLEQRLLLANASRGGGCQWCPLENVSQRNLEHPLRKRNTTTTTTNRRRHRHNKNERKDGVRALVELHSEMLVGSRRRASSSTYFGAT